MKLSITKIKAFKSCRRLYELKYVEGLRPVQKVEALEIGSNYHKLLEEMNKGNFEPMTEDDYSKEQAMARAYYKYIYPNFHVVEVEKELEMDLGDGNKLIGYADGIADDGHIVEHKTCGSKITEQYEYNLLWDEQILAYMLMTGKRKVWYTICRKPTIRQKQNESAEEFFNRMVEWYDEDTESKIRLLEIERTDAEVAEFEKNLHNMLRIMKEAELNDADIYRNTCHCNQYGRRCEYSSVCLHYDPNQEYIEFTKGEKSNGIEENSAEF